MKVFLGYKGKQRGSASVLPPLKAQPANQINKKPQGQIREDYFQGGSEFPASKRPKR